MSEIAWLSERDDDDPGRLRTAEDRTDDCTPTCEECGGTFTVGAVSLAGVGLFCSRPCADRGVRRHELALMGRKRA